ncbi:MAG: putative transposase, partial [Acidimicrobiales bacterium]
FASGEPRGLTKSLPEVLGQLVEICGGRRILLGFDRGGSYPVLFAKLAEEGVGFLTYRRAPLATPGVAPRRSWVKVDGRRVGYRVADEMVELEGVGAVRQLSVYDAGKVVLQVLTSDTGATAAYLCHMLRCRWRIENTFKYLEDHHGIHWLSDYAMELRPDPSLVANPERTAAKATLKAAGAALECAEQALGRQSASPSRPIEDHLATMRSLRDDVAMAADDVAEAKAALKGVPAKVAATALDPDATRATPRLARRALQMVCRLLAYNAELDLARRLNAYLVDPDEYRTITRHLLHLGGRIVFAPRAVTVTLDRPDVPRVARALGLLIDEINATPAHIPATADPSTTALQPPEVDLRAWPYSWRSETLSGPPVRAMVIRPRRGRSLCRITRDLHGSLLWEQHEPVQSRQEQSHLVPAKPTSTEGPSCALIPRNASVTIERREPESPSGRVERVRPVGHELEIVRLHNIKVGREQRRQDALSREEHALT